MSNEEFKNKYRPRTFDEFLGNKSAVESIKKTIGDVHTYLFHGMRGCGKTTLARLIASELEITSIDIYEMDAADKTGVDDARQIKALANFSAMGGDKKIYIIDEVHRMTGNAQDSLLKTLEEPPDHVYFVLCTTVIDKVAITVRSRVASYQVQPLTRRNMAELLDWVIDSEKLDIEGKVLAAIMKSSDGVPREALMLLDMVKGLDIDDALEVCEKGTTDDIEVKELINFLMRLNKKSTWEQASTILKGINGDMEKIRRGMLAWFTSVMLNSTVKPGNAALIVYELSEPFYNTGKAGLVLAVYRMMFP